MIITVVQTGIISPIFENGNYADWKNYRGIAKYKGNHLYKSTGKLNQRSARKILEDTQCGFRKGRGTLDNVFT